MTSVPMRWSRRRKLAWLAAIPAVIAIMGGVAEFTGYNLDRLWVVIHPTTAATPSSPLPSPTVSITSPTKTVAVHADVVGTVTNLGSGREVWVFVEADDGKMYPQLAPAIVDRSGVWTRTGINVGERGEVGVSFAILAVVATKDAGLAISQCLDRAEQTRIGCAYSRLPEGATVGARVPLVRV